MPILECDPWREQYFANVPCPPEVIVPTDDAASWRLFPRFRWVFNKLLVCQTQMIEHGPHGVEPRSFPVFSKPIYNLRGMGVGSRVIRSAEECRSTQTPGHMWMELLEGEHLSTDIAVMNGEAAWCRHAFGCSAEQGTFDHWVVMSEPRPELERFLFSWLRSHLRGYTGMVNCESIGGRIIECHLRFSDQWPDLCGGDAWVKAVVGLYGQGRWEFDDSARRTGYSVVLWGPHGVRYHSPDRRQLDALRQRDSISSTQITFHPDRRPEDHSMPPGGFRLAIVNCWDLDAGRQARELLRQAMLSESRS